MPLLRDFREFGWITVRSDGEQTAVIGYDESQQLDVDPARYFVCR